jgi:hypothetical protein
MSNAKTGVLSAFGALLGGAAGAFAGRYAVQMRPRTQSSRRVSYQEVEDAMVIGAGAGSVIGAFVGGTLGGEEAPQVVAVAARPTVQPQLRYP